jgi:hypothetical protein
VVYEHADYGISCVVSKNDPPPQAKLVVKNTSILVKTKYLTTTVLFLRDKIGFVAYFSNKTIARFFEII